MSVQKDNQIDSGKTGWEKALVQQALDAREKAYAPYSGFKVGAALLCGEGRVYTGCNIENSAYTPSNCAERTAFFKAVSEGVRDFQAIAVVGGREKAEEECPPCGVCRQVMAEFCSGDFMILLGREGKDLQWRAFTLDQLLPLSFSL
ncbi:cytidine deaminase [Catenibacillus scindens]|uniref:Cytidine deaminase n=1 Tax=Catenibacillus scindens TaxID=673271 RepID=A0A7W8H7Q1_9FIRM|nr:cytidine deaminase [Catenibacillus scindens]